MTPRKAIPTSSPPAEAPNALDPRVRTAIAAVAAAGAALTLAALLLRPRAGLSVAAGAAIAVLNLWVIARIVGSLLPGHRAGARAQSRAGWGLVALLKMLGLFAVVGLLMRHGLVSALPLVAGFCSLPIGIVIGSLVSDRSAHEPDEDQP